MHYIGQRSISSIPYISYSPFLVVLSVVIACLAVTIALWTMFIVLKPKLAHSWIKKFGVACVLGSGTVGRLRSIWTRPFLGSSLTFPSFSSTSQSLMHYTAMLGTTYLVDMNIGEFRAVLVARRRRS